jgi:hypothetical protein
LIYEGKENQFLIIGISALWNDIKNKIQGKVRDISYIFSIFPLITLFLSLRSVWRSYAFILLTSMIEMLSISLKAFSISGPLHPWEVTRKVQDWRPLFPNNSWRKKKEPMLKWESSEVLKVIL